MNLVRNKTSDRHTQEGYLYVSIFNYKEQKLIKDSNKEKAVSNFNILCFENKIWFFSANPQTYMALLQTTLMKV